jgi:hypothetical protein
MIGFIGTTLQLQSVITAHILTFLTTSVLRISQKNLLLHWVEEWTLCGPIMSPRRTVSCPLLFCYPLLRNISCLVTCYMATTRSLLFVVTETWFPIRCPAMDVCYCCTIPAFSRRVSICTVFQSEQFPRPVTVVAWSALFYVSETQKYWVWILFGAWILSAI